MLLFVQESGAYQTTGIDMLVTGERVVLLDTQVCSAGRTGTFSWMHGYIPLPPECSHMCTKLIPTWSKWHLSVGNLKTAMSHTQIPYVPFINMSAAFNTEWLLVSKGSTSRVPLEAHCKCSLGSLRSWNEASTFNSDDNDVVHLPAFGETKLSSSVGPPTLCFRDNILSL